MSTYKELLEQREQLEQRIAEAKATGRAEAIATAMQLIRDYELTASELGFKGKPGPKHKSTPVPAKYRDLHSSKTWSGRGKQPKWVIGNRDQYLIQSH